MVGVYFFSKCFFFYEKKRKITHWNEKLGLWHQLILSAVEIWYGSILNLIPRNKVVSSMLFSQKKLADSFSYLKKKLELQQLVVVVFMSDKRKSDQELPFLIFSFQVTKPFIILAIYYFQGSDFEKNLKIGYVFY